MRVCLTIGGLSSEYGGPSYTVPALAHNLAALGLQVELITCRPETVIHRDTERLKYHFLAYCNRTTRWLPFTNHFASTLRASSSGAVDCVIHDTGLWLPTNHAVASAARRLTRPLIISPRGMLTDWAMKFRGLKKRIAWLLYQQRDLQVARVLHATSDGEAQSFRALGMRQPIAIIPNGVELPEGEGARSWETGDRAQAESRSRSTETPNHRNTVLFLGRIHPVKGLMNLVRAWADIQRTGDRRQRSDWRLVIAGRDENGHLAELREECRKQNVERSVEFIGPVEGDAKWDLYRSADVFVLPSHSENFGQVVAEALACGVPVLTTKGAPWQELETHRCGWWVDIGVEPLQRALSEALSVSDEERQAMGARGRALVESKYAWPRVAAQMKSVYEWMLGLGAKPHCMEQGARR